MRGWRYTNCSALEITQPVATREIVLDQCKHKMVVMTQPAPVAKRKAIDDYFARPSKRLAVDDRSPICAQPVPEPNCSSNTGVPGLQLHDSFVTPAEEEEILTFLNDPSKCTWRTDLSRRTMHFGGTYCLFDKNAGTQAQKPTVLQAPPMPDTLSWLLDRMVDADVFEADKRPQYCMLVDLCYSLWWSRSYLESQH